MSIVIKTENISKQYRLGEVGTGALSHDLNRWWHKVRGKEDPYLVVGETNDRTSKGDSEYVWALQDINFEVQQGEVLGIIGRNGAGKSTLLKILSRTTTPTTGCIKVKGRIASLLEVGTGFHPELSGRDNIFLNGAILGMTKKEIRNKFDEIVDFAGVERYIDTPVKRYSSGMYVRLAFGVAAHLESEILIVDEVLAVGDAEFQKKCLGKMSDVSRNHGRTILFVSHNMAAVKQLCKRGLLLVNGQLAYTGDMQQVAEKYQLTGVSRSAETFWDEHEAPGNEKIRVRRVKVSAMGKKSSESVTTADIISVEIIFENKQADVDLDVTWDIFDLESVHVCHIGKIIGDGGKIGTGIYCVEFLLPANILNSKRYYFNVLFGEDQRHVIYSHERILSVDIEDALQREGASFHQYPGAIHPAVKWNKRKLEQVTSATA